MRTDDAQGNDAPDPTGRCTAKGASLRKIPTHTKTPLVVTLSVTTSSAVGQVKPVTGASWPSGCYLPL